MSERPLFDTKALQKIEAGPGEPFALNLLAYVEMVREQELERLSKIASRELNGAKVLFLQEGNRMDKQTGPKIYRQATLRVNYELLADLLGLPPETRVVAVSDQVRFLTNELVFKVEDDGLPATEGGHCLPELLPQVTTGKYATCLDWGTCIPMAAKTVWPDAAKLAALCRHAALHLREAPYNELADELEQAARELEADSVVGGPKCHCGVDSECAPLPQESWQPEALPALSLDVPLPEAVAACAADDSSAFTLRQAMREIFLKADAAMKESVLATADRIAGEMGKAPLTIHLDPVPDAEVSLKGTSPVASARPFLSADDIYAFTLGMQAANECPQGHHLKDGPCMSDYCRCSCSRCRQQCERSVTTKENRDD